MMNPPQTDPDHDRRPAAPSQLKGDGTPPRGQIWFLTGAKGGAGATVIGTSLAWTLAEQGLRVVFIDLDLHEGQAAMHLCERNAGPTVADAVGALDRLDAVLLDTLLTPVGPRLRVLPSPPSTGWSQTSVRNGPWLDPQALRRVAEQAATLADIVLLDAPSRVMDPRWADWLDEADHRIILTEPTLSALYNTRQWLENLRSSTGQPCEMVINKVERRNVLKPEDVRRALAGMGWTSWRELPRSDEAVAQAVHHGWAIGKMHPRDALAVALTAWACEVKAQSQWGAPQAQDVQRAPAPPALPSTGLLGAHRWLPLQQLWRSPS